MLDMDVLHQAVKAMTRASRSFWNLTTLVDAPLFPNLPAI